MKRLIPIERDAAILTAKMLSSYVGNMETSETGVSMYDQIHIITQDREFLKENIEDFVLAVAQLCGEYLVETTHTDIELDMPVEFTDGLWQTLCKTVNECMENYIFSKWMAHTKQKDREEVYSNQYKVLLLSANEILYMRRLPNVPQQPPSPTP